MSENSSTSRRKELTGQIFGKWTVLHFAKREPDDRFWLCKCTCGRERTVRQRNLLQGLSQSCGTCSKFLPDGVYDEIIKNRILSNVKINSQGCWEWQKGKDGGGYGSISIRRKSKSAHIVAFQLFVGPTNGLFVLHSCDNPPCCNPSHLFLGTHTDNMQDMYKKGRGANRKGESHPLAKLTQVQVDQIRSLYATGEYSQAKLAVMYNMTGSGIGRIVKNITWVLP